MLINKTIKQINLLKQPIQILQILKYSNLNINQFKRTFCIINNDNDNDNNLKSHSPLFNQTSSERQQKIKELLDSIIRVNQAGEFGAKRIYQGQLDALKGTEVEPIIQHMAEQEEIHLETFNKLIVDYRVRPTALYPIWNIAAYALGYFTGKLGKEAAMACTVAVETVIGEHYNSQLRQLNELGVDEAQLRQFLCQFRDDELEHLNTSLEHNAEQVENRLLINF
eukprot:TRINITY_DN1065_c3_g1_i3.p1 TRINITY_DN1065_c3_g1~~TRINITY_DN1065_c3_g1_i3.p1  ORF type:complete len:224 (-),score=97.82 TRINITY_DN1065_c3_g1_i3:146-817(-)